MPLSDEQRKEQRRIISLRSRNKHRALVNERGRKRWAKLRDARYESYMMYNVRMNAKKTGREVTITEADISIPERCPVLGIELRRDCSRVDRDAAPSLDRIDNNRGYVPGNVIVVSMRATQIKGTATTEELEKVLNFYKGLPRK